MKKILGKAKTERQRKEVLAAALIERKFRRERKRQAAEGGLIHFVRYFWDVLEPGAEFIDGWHLHALCEHLEAMHRGDMTRLLINVPPGAMKSLLVNVFFPAWVWSAGGRADLRFVSFSYGSYLTERDNERMLTLLKSQKFIDLWGNAFRLTAEGKVKISNSKRGWKFASSVGGVGTGERGDYILCFPEETLVATECGPMRIGDIVRQRLDVRVWSRNPTTGLIELKPVVGWRNNPGSDILKLRMSDGGSIRCTPDHRIWMASATASGMVVSTPNQSTLGEPEMPPRLPASDSRYRGDVDAELSSKLSSKLGKGAVIDLYNLFVSKVSSAIPKVSIAFAVSNVLRPCPIFEIGKPTIGSDIVPVPDFLPVRTGADESEHDELMGEAIDALSANAHGNPGVSIIDDRGEDAAFHGHVPPPSSSYSWKTADSAKIGDVVFPFEARNGEPCFVSSVEFDRHVDETFCLTVEGNHNMFVGTGQELYLVSNCDDPHNVKDGDASIIRENTVRWFKEAMSNRLNDMVKSRIIVIMQRVADDDVAGTILDEGLPYEHLMIPMEYEPHRHCETSIGWEDPRTTAGECYWPERFPPEAVADCKAQGPFAWNSQYQQRPQVRGNEIFNPEWWNIWDPPDGKFPDLDYVIAVLDPAFTSKDDNDPSGFVVLGAFCTDEGNRAVILLNAWREWLQLHGRDTDKLPGETRAAHKSRTKGDWGLVETVADSCRRFGVDRLIIESKACGISVAQEMQRLYREDNWFVELVDPKGLDKMARAQRVQPIFSEGQVWAPDRKWATMVINEMAVFPRGKHDDLVDAMTYGLWHMRERGYLTRRAERRAENEAGKRFEKRQAALYPV